MSAQTDAVRQHYSQGGLLGRVQAALEAVGKGSGTLTPQDLAPLDQFHTRGIGATLDLIEFAELRTLAAGRHLRAIDVGSGLGGPARVLATGLGADVSGVDLVPEFCEVAGELSRRCGLEGVTRFQVGSALELPADDGAFDLAWTFQVQMNIADKARFYGEIARVLRPGGRLCFQDLCAGPAGVPVDFPVPWASDAAHSHLVPPAEMREALLGVGLREVKWRDMTAEALAWQQAHLVQPGQTLPPLGLHLVMGDTYPAKRANTSRALETGRLATVQGLFEKSA